MLDVGVRIREEQIYRIIEKEKPRRVGLEAPDGLVNVLLSLSDSIEKKYGVKSVILFDPTYGICDLANLSGKRLGLDLIFNVGHSVGVEKIGKHTYFIDAEYEVDFRPVLDKAVRMLSGRFSKVGVITISNNKSQIDGAITYLNENGLKAVKGVAEGILFDGQIFGCNYYSAKNIVKEVDGFVFLGQSRFHSIGVSLTTRKPTFMLDPFFNMVEDVENEAKLIERKAILAVLKAKDATSIGIIMSIKEGQLFRRRAEEIKEKLSRLGKKTYMYTMREITPDRLKSVIGIDAFVETACPRISLDNEGFGKPILSYEQGLGLIRLLEGKELGDMFGSGLWM